MSLELAEEKGQARMTAGVRRKKKKDEIKVTIAPFRDRADYKSCEEIQREVWRSQDIDIVPASLLISASRTGGTLLGAYNSLGDLVGFAFSLLGSDGDRLIHHAHMLAVRVAYRNFDVGFKLKQAQRKEVLRRKISLITSSFDPMQPLHAYFTLGKLGACAGVYEEDYYGETTSLLERGLPTDRMLAVWDLESRNVVRRLENGAPRHDLRKELKQVPVINQLVEAAPGMMACSPVKLACTDPQILFEVPYNLPEIKSRDLGIALEWQGRMRQVFGSYFNKGYAASDFWVVEQDGHLRTFYLLERR